jgi:protein-tyrosine-phosphatase
MNSCQLEERDVARQIAQKLAPEFAGVFSPETIERSAVEGYAYYSSMVESGEAMSNYLPILTERFVRNRLQFVRTDRLAFAEAPEVLFVCVRNAGRSQIAAALLEHYGQGQARGRSAGSSPASEIQPEVQMALGERGIDMSGRYPKHLTNEALRSADLIITLGCGDACPILPGKHYLDWAVPDPHGRSLDAVRVIVADIADRVQALLAELPDPRDHEVPPSPPS